MGLTMNQAIALLVVCAVVQIVGVYYKKNFLIHLSFFCAMLVDFFWTDFNPVALFRFPLLWLFVALEQWKPRNAYSINSYESLKSMAIYPLRQSVGIVAKFVVPIIWSPFESVSLHLKTFMPIWAQIIITILLCDLVLYSIHRAQHYFDFYFTFHKIHHASKEIHALANFRTNIFELAFIQGGARTIMYSLLGVATEVKITGSVFAYIVGGLLAHSNLNFPTKRFRWLNRLIQTPNVHAWHHYPRGPVYNFGESTTIWDQVFGTFKQSEVKPQEFGLDDVEFSQKNLFQQHLEPLRFLKNKLSRKSSSSEALS